MSRVSTRRSQTVQGVRLVTRTGRKRRELVELCIERVGVKMGARTALRLTQWAIIAARIGHFPSVREFHEQALVDERTGWRYRAVIREAFSEEEFRSLVLQLVQAGVAEKTPRGAAKLLVLV